jgi:hypothetical protein
MAKKSAVEYVRAELARYLLIYSIIWDCIEGEPAIKGLIDTTPFGLSGGVLPVPAAPISDISKMFNVTRAQRYLPKPNAEDKSEDNAERYRAYINRAVFYNATSRTLDGMVGQVFLREPVVEVPEELKPFIQNVDGNGLNITQLAKRGVRSGLPYGRGGIHVDYPKTSGPTTVQDIKSGKVQPVFNLFYAWDIPNWRTAKEGAKSVYTMIVLREFVDEQLDGFTQNIITQYRVLRYDIKAKIHTVEIHRQNPSTKNSQFDIFDKFTPMDAKGKPFTEIPFRFFGAENNDQNVDRPPMYDLASLNIAHYRNSADYEESCFMVGQPTPWVSGVTEEWVKNVLKGNLALGSRAGISLPQGASAGLLESKGNGLVSEAMAAKERQMVALGAKLVQQSEVQRTATDAIMEESAQSSTLANVAVNVGSAIAQCLKWAARMIGAAEDKIVFTLNTQFDLMRLSLDDQSKLVANWQKGAITWSEMRAGLRKAGVATMADDEAKTAVADEFAELIKTGLVADPFGETGTAGAGGGGAPSPKADPAKQATTGRKGATGAAN